jgi:DNA-binding beta-propeller fold protein YncE
VFSVIAAIGPALRSHRRFWWVAAWVAASAILLAVLTLDVFRFLYGGVTVLPVGESPSGLVVSPDGRTIYLADPADGITPVSAATGKAGKAIAISGGAPGGLPFGGLAITPDGRTLYEESNSALLARVDLRAGKETGQVQVPRGVNDFVMSRDGKTLFVVSGDSQLYAVNAVTGRPERHFPVPQSVLEGEEALVLSPDGGTLYMATAPDVGSGTDGPVTPVNLRTGATGRAVDAGWNPAALAITPDGRTLYVAINGMEGEIGQVYPNRIVAIDTATDRVRASIPWKVPPQQLAMARDGATVWVVSVTGDRRSTADDTVTPVSVASDRPGSSIRTGGWLNADKDAPMGVRLSPDGRRLYVAVYSGLEMFGAG